MRRILLARHGQTAWNAAGRLQGHTDIPLDDVGRDQARALARSIAGTRLTSIWTSDLLRARQTGELVAAALELAPPAVEPELRERRFGVFEGLTRDQCAAQHPAAWRGWLDRTAVPEGCEPPGEVVARFTRALTRIVERTDGTALVVTHGGAMRLWLMEHLAEIPPITNGATYLVEHDGAAFVARGRFVP